MNYQTRTLLDKQFLNKLLEDPACHYVERTSSDLEKKLRVAGLRILTDDVIWAREQWKNLVG